MGGATIVPRSLLFFKSYVTLLYLIIIDFGED